MIERIQTWFAERTRREQWLLGIAAGLTGFALVVFGMIMPAIGAISSAQKQLDLATERRGRIEASALLVSTRPKDAPSTPTAANLETIITEGAIESGFEIADGAAIGTTEYRFRFASIKASALLAWLAQLEAQRIELAHITLRRGEGGFVSADIMVRRKM